METISAENAHLRGELSRLQRKTPVDAAGIQQKPSSAMAGLLLRETDGENTDNPGLIAQCNNAPVPGSLQCNIATTATNQCRLEGSGATATHSECATFYGGAGSQTKCTDGPISWRGFFVYAVSANWDLCFSWQYISHNTGYIIHGRDGVSNKAVVGHDSRMSSGVGYLVSKRMKCTATVCKVYKSGLCINLKNFAGLSPPYSTPFAYQNNYADYGGTKTTGRHHANTLAEAIVMFAHGAETLLREVQGTSLPAAQLPAAYRCSETSDPTWNESSGSDAAQATKSIGLF